MEYTGILEIVIQVGIIQEQDRNALLTEISQFHTMLQVFNYIFKDQPNDIIMELAAQRQIRDAFKPELNLWRYKIELARAFNEEHNQDMLETIDQVLRKYYRQKELVFKYTYELYTGEKPTAKEIAQINEELFSFSYLLEELREKTIINPYVDQEYSREIEEKINKAQIQSQREYYEGIQEKLKDLPQTLISHKLNQASLDLGSKYFVDRQQPLLPEYVRQMVSDLKVENPQGKRAQERIIKGENIRRNFKILMRIFCGFDILGVQRKMKKINEEGSKKMEKMKSRGKKIKFIAFFGPSRTLIARLMGYEMRNAILEGTKTILPEKIFNIEEEHIDLVIGHSKKPTPQHYKVFQVPGQLLPLDDIEEYDTYCMDSGDIQDSDDVQFQLLNKMTTIEMLNKADQVQVVVVINQKNWGGIEKLAKSVTSYFRDFSKIKKSVKFVFDGFDNQFKQSFHAHVVSLYKSIQEQSNYVVDENYRQFFLLLIAQTKKVKEMMIIDLLNLNPIDFFEELFSKTEFIEQTFIHLNNEIDTQCEIAIKRFIQRCRFEFHQQYDKGNMQGAWYYIKLLNKTTFIPKFKFEINAMIEEIKNSLPQSLEKSIDNIETRFKDIQMPSLSVKQQQEQINEIFQLSQRLQKQICKYKEFDQSSKLSQKLNNEVAEAGKWYLAKLNDWKDPSRSRLEQLIDSTIIGRYFLELFCPTYLQEYKKCLFEQEKCFMTQLHSQIELMKKQNQVSKYFKLLCAIQQSQQKQIDHQNLNDAITQQFEQRKKRITVISFNGEQQGKLMPSNQQNEAAQIQSILEFIKIVEKYPKQLLTDHQEYQRIFNLIVIQKPMEYIRKYYQIICQQYESSHLEVANQRKAIEDAIRKLNLLNQIKIVRQYYGGQDISQENGIKRMIRVDFEKIHQIIASFNKNQISDIQEGMRQMQSQWKKLGIMLKMADNTQFEDQFCTLKQLLGESVQKLINQNIITETLTFKDTGTLSKIFEKYSKLIEFQKIPKLLQNDSLKETLSKMIKRIEEKVKSPIETMKRQISSRNIINVQKLKNYLSYLDIIKNEGAHIFLNQFNLSICDIDEQISKEIQRIHSDVSVNQLKKMGQVLEKNLSLDEGNVKNILDNISLDQADKCHQALKIIVEAKESEELKEKFFTDLDHLWRSSNDILRLFKNNLQEKVNSENKTNALGKLGKVANLMKKIEVEIQGEINTFSDISDEIAKKIREKIKGDQRKVTRLVEAGSELANFDAENYANIYRSACESKGEQGRKNVQELDQLLQDYRKKVHKKLDILRIEMSSTEDRYDKKIIQFFQIINKYHRNLTFIKDKCGESTLGANQQHQASNIEPLISYFEDKVIEDSRNIMEEFMYLKQQEINKGKMSLQSIEREMSELSKGPYELSKYNWQLKRLNSNSLCESLMRLKEQRKQKLQSLKDGKFINKIDGDFVKFINGIQRVEKQRIQGLIQFEIGIEIDSLKYKYYDNEADYLQHREGLVRKISYLEPGLQSKLFQKLKEVEGVIRENKQPKR